MKVTYFYRHPNNGFSIRHVFETLTHELINYVDVEEWFMPAKNSMPWDMVRNCIYTFRHRNKNGMNHITGHIHDVLLALGCQKTVLTVHDLVFLDHVGNPLKRFYKWLFWLYLPVKMADRVVCVSEHTRHNIEKYLRTDKLCVIPNPIDPSYRYVEKMFNENKPVILHIGTGWNKNLRRTIEALEGISCHLRIIGKLDRDILDLLQMKQVDYSNNCHLTNEEIVEEYIACDIVNFPSEYEGFGMPVIEGQKTGRVVLASRIEPLIDISGNAVEYVNPHSVESLRQGYLRLINDANHRNELIQSGLKNVERYSVQTIAKQYVHLYCSLIEE